MVATSFIGGMLLGLASSVHCAGMCGGIGASVAFTFGGDGRVASRMEALAVAQVGKTLAYVTAGLIVGALGSAVYGLLDRQAAYFILQRVGAAGLGWVGLGLLGIAPQPRGLDRLLAPVRGALLRQRRSGRALAAGAAGLVWGLMPCGMVYSALLYAMLAGSGAGGGMVMLGFGLGVTPAVFAAASGVSWLPAVAKSPWAERAVGLGLIALAAVTLIWPMGAIEALCAPLL